MTTFAILVLLVVVGLGVTFGHRAVIVSDEVSKQTLDIEAMYFAFMGIQDTLTRMESDKTADGHLAAIDYDLDLVAACLEGLAQRMTDVDFVLSEIRSSLQSFTNLSNNCSTEVDSDV